MIELSPIPNEAEVLPPPRARWLREFFTLRRHEVVWLERVAHREECSPNQVMRRLIEEAMERERERDDADATLNADVSGAMLR